MQVGLRILGEDTGVPQYPAKIARLLTHRERRCNKTECPERKGSVAAKPLVRTARTDMTRIEQSIPSQSDRSEANTLAESRPA